MSPNIVGRVINNRYRVDAFVASGGMGEVYRVWDSQRSAYLAMKVLRGDPAEDAAEFRLFQREAEALKTLSHPHIVPFYGLEQAGDFSFILEAFVDGPSLKQVLSERRSMPIQEAMTYLKAIASALGFAHNQGFVHCDVKPGNVMTDHGGNVFLADFGIVRHSGSTTTTTSLTGSGTPAYMAPEQALGISVTAATDVYALGVMFYELIAGQRPFSGNEPETMVAGPSLSDRIRHAHIHLPPPDPRSFNPQLPAGFSQVLLTALAKLPDQRYTSTIELFEAACLAAGFQPEQVPSRLATAQKSAAPEAPVITEPVITPTPPTRNPQNIPLEPEPQIYQTPFPPAQSAPQPAPRAAPQPAPAPVPVPRPQPQPKRMPWLMIAIAAAFLCAGGAGILAIPRILGLVPGGQRVAVIPLTIEPEVTATDTERPPEPTSSPEPTLEEATPTPPVIVYPTDTLSPTATRAPLSERVLIPAGEFRMGVTERDLAVETNPRIITPESPLHTLYLDEYWIDKYEVTNQLFQQFVQETGYITIAERYGGQVYSTSERKFIPETRANWRLPDGYSSLTSSQANHPVVQMSWSDARQFCEWAGGRLPTEAEWEKAARGSDSRLYPWGNTYNGNLLNGSDKTLGQDPQLAVYDDGYAFTAPIGSYPGGASPYGVMDMAGNALEWVHDFARTNYYSESPNKNPTGPDTGNTHVLRGGSWYSGPRNNRVAHRVFAEHLEIAVQNFGFRCAYDK